MIRFICILLFCSSLHFISNAQYSSDLQNKIEDVRTASYADSARLFTIGKQTIDFALSSNQNAAIADVHLLYGNHFFYIRDFTKAERYYLLALKEADSLNNKDIHLLANTRLSFLKFERGNTTVAEDELNELLKEARTKKDYKNEVELLNLLGIICEARNDIKGALKLYLQGLTTSEIHNLSYYPAVFRNNLGLIKLMSGQKEEALIDFEKGLKISEREKNDRLSSHIQMNICMIKVSDNNPEQANDLFAKVIAYSKKNNLPTELASNYLNLSLAYSNAKRSNEALLYIDSAIFILKQQGLKEELTKAYLRKAINYIDNANYSNAENILIETEKLSAITGILEDIASTHLLRYRIYEAQKNYQLALKEYLAYSSINDSLSNQVNGKVVEELQHSFDVQKKEIELERERSKSLLLEESNQNERFLKWISIGTGIMVILLLLLILNNRYVRKIREKQELFSRQLIQSIEDERKRIAIDLHDDIGQSLSIIKSKIIKEQQQNQNSLKQVDVEISHVIEQTREISKNLFPSNIEKIGLIRSIALMMESIQSSTNLVCSFEITPSVETLNTEQKTHVFRIIQECTNNTIKHSGASGLKIEISEKANEFMLVYQDNGKGLVNKNQKNGIGIRSLTERARILNGTIDITDDKNGKGLKLQIKFKPLK